MKRVFITLCLSLFCCFAITASVVSSSSGGIYIQLTVDDGPKPPTLPPPTRPPSDYEGLITQSSNSISTMSQPQLLSSTDVVDIELYNSKGVLVSQQQTTLNPQGFVYVTTQGLPQGCYTVKATIMGNVVGVYNIGLQ